MYWVLLVLGVTRLLRPGIFWVAGFTINSVVLIVDWGSEGGPKVSTKAHDPLFINGMMGIGTVEDIGGTCAT